MTYRIEIKEKIQDSRNLIIKNQIESFGFEKKIKEINVVDVYTLNNNFNIDEVAKIASILTNPVSQEFFINNPAIKEGFDFALEIGFLPGVTDNVGNTAHECI